MKKGENILSTVLFALIAIASYILLLKFNSPLEKSDVGFAVVYLFFSMACVGADFIANEEMGNLYINDFSASSITDVLVKAEYLYDRNRLWSRSWFKKTDMVADIYRKLRDSLKLKYMAVSLCSIGVWLWFFDLIAKIEIKNIIIFIVVFGLFYRLSVQEVFGGSATQTIDIVSDIENELSERGESLSIMERVLETEKLYKVLDEEYFDLICSKIKSSNHNKMEEFLVLFIAPLTPFCLPTFCCLALKFNAIDSIKICSCIFIAINIILTIT